MIIVEVQRRLCDSCFDRDKEFYKWSEGGIFLSKETAVEKRKEFWDYAIVALAKPCINLDSSEQDLALCLECMIEMTRKLAKKTGRAIFVVEPGT